MKQEENLEVSRFVHLALVGAKGYCLSTPCCYAINCNISNRSFGLCYS
ncbi:Dynein intermediate chain 1 [Bienertia sinuspersici]